MDNASSLALDAHPIHLDSNSGAGAQPRFTGDMAWYDAYVQRHAADGVRGRLVSMYTFTEPWTSWEMHPSGSEVVVCTAGEMTLHQEQGDGSVTSVRLRAGEYAINPPGIWHTADVQGSATALFITAGWGTQHRPR
ncbi:MAG: cupin domain-containing protein [Betaproteobacteria bacterium]|nr:cupin domain-containing protein [Betaproteobacteria bacterium]